MCWTMSWPSAAAALGLGHARLKVRVALRRGRVQAPLHVLFPGLPVLDRMIHVLGHEAGAAALEAEHVPAREILYYLVLAAVLQHLVFEAGRKLGLAPAQPPQPVVAGRVEPEEFFERHVLRHALFLPPLQAVVTEFLLKNRRAGSNRIGVAQLARAGRHLARGERARERRPRGLRSIRVYLREECRELRRGHGVSCPRATVPMRYRPRGRGPQLSRQETCAKRPVL